MLLEEIKDDLNKCSVQWWAPPCPAASTQGAFTEWKLGEELEVEDQGEMEDSRMLYLHVQCGTGS